MQDFGWWRLCLALRLPGSIKEIIMGYFKTFFLGVFTAYGVYYITRKGADGRSILDELLDNPSRVMSAAENVVIRDTVHAIKEEIS